MDYVHTVLFFSLYSFAGWIVEVVYRSWSQKRFVNAGFLHGCFVPIYGFGALTAIGLDSLMSGAHPLLKMAVIAVIVTAIEYAVGLVFERLFGLKLWDYTANRFNLHGRVSLLYSVFWTAMAGVLIFVVHPRVQAAVLSLPDAARIGAGAAFSAYFSADFIFSAMSLRVFKERIAYLRDNYARLSNGELGPIMHSLRRLLGAFPNLNVYLSGNMHENLKDRVSLFLEGIQSRIPWKGKPVPSEKEYSELVKDILSNEEFLRLKDFHHHSSSIYHHAVSVSYLSYRVSRQLKLDYRSVARGGLLHDFFLYDWRNHDEPDLARDRYHGVEHPRIALENSLRHFVLNDIERDIIVKHMWPLTPVPPRYRESYVVTFVDKYLASKEYLQEFRKKRAGKKKTVRERGKKRRRGEG